MELQIGTLQGDLIELDCGTLPNDLLLGSPNGHAFQPQGGFSSGDIIREGADGKGGRFKALAHSNAPPNAFQVT